jgi:transposase-like protein
MEFGPSTPTIYGWVAEANSDAGTQHEGLTSAERDEELSRLRRENRLNKPQDLLFASVPYRGTARP